VDVSLGSLGFPKFSISEGGRKSEMIQKLSKLERPPATIEAPHFKVNIL
jgi:hypothetical protein